LLRAKYGVFIVSVVWTQYGAPAYETLHTVLSGLKKDDPLTPVTILVPNQNCGVAARRFLAHGVSGRDGVAGLSVLPVDRLAEQLAAPALVGGGRRPATGAVVAATWRRALDEEPGVFAPVATHPATVRALAAAHRELREVDDAAHDAMARFGNPVTADLYTFWGQGLVGVGGGRPVPVK
jgi:ATP-dependent helicase/nuclease subunit B